MPLAIEITFERTVAIADRNKARTVIPVRGAAGVDVIHQAIATCQQGGTAARTLQAVYICNPIRIATAAITTRCT